MNIDSAFTLEAPFASLVETAPIGARLAPASQNVWARDRGDSRLTLLAGGAVLVLSNVVIAATFAHVFLG